MTAGRYGMDLRRPLAMVSGGPDSVALLRVILALGGEPVALHVDHGLRGEQSREDAEFVSDLCGQLGVPCEVCRIWFEDRSNLQERAREKRYALAEEVAVRLGLRVIATGHTADDVAETVLMNLARGAGLRGLGGIPPVRGRIQRPLIGSTRSDVLHYLEELDQPFRWDPTNLTDKYARNRVRGEILPVLEQLYPAAASNIARAASLVREDLEVLEDLAKRIVQRRGEEVVLARDGLEGLRPSLRRHAVRLAYTTLLPEAAPLPSSLVEAALGLLEGGEGTRTLDLPGGVVASGRASEELAFYSEPRPMVSNQEEIRAGQTVVFGGWRISAQKISGYDPVDAGRAGVAYIDAGKGPYEVRMAQEGDIIRPLGLGGTKKVMRALMDRKVPSDLRRRTPVVVDGRDEVAWIVFGELDERHKVDERTQKVLRLEVEGIS
ncbi:MAG: tRNA lysidine(34) synthetase TilS [Actinomycetota bacterium]|nr:tRNA lysidine(34) synthetase TilS [Actinomycetota bacterium]